MQRHIEQRIADLEDALARGEKGLHGKCEDCGHVIAPERLEALPTTTLCFDCATKAR